MHLAKNCYYCPGTNGGPPMCNGQCKWDYTSDTCVDRGNIYKTKYITNSFVSSYHVFIFIIYLIQFLVQLDNVIREHNRENENRPIPIGKIQLNPLPPTDSNEYTGDLEDSLFSTNKSVGTMSGLRTYKHAMYLDRHYGKILIATYHIMLIYI